MCACAACLRCILVAVFDAPEDVPEEVSRAPAAAVAAVVEVPEGVSKSERQGWA